MRFGIHAGPQDCTIDELRRLWRVADEQGFHWCSVWDHLYSVSDLTNPAKPSFEGIATMAGLAASTRNVRVGSLVFCVGYRNVGVLAKAAVTIDHLSGGRCELGLGAGWNENEFRAFDMPFKPIKDRLDAVEEQAIVLRRLFDGERVTFAGKQVRLDDALCEPRPVQKKLRLWIGGQGEKRMLRIVARHADGWNVPFLAPETWKQRNDVLDQWCETERRDPRAVIRTANVGLAIGEDEARARRQDEELGTMFGGMADWVRPGHLRGTPSQVRERVAEYERAGVQWLILALRAPFDWSGLDLFIREVMPAFAPGDSPC
jgi:alkanesulfonate monooxygenase SsuD/methylene tetrahydromethanopterin reductase-like flavin-dependent oxidoreductase (luciferase family)